MFVDFIYLLEIRLIIMNYYGELIKPIFSEIVSEAFQTKCKLCTEKQKYMLDEISDWYTKNDPEKWNAFVAKSLEDMKKKAKE